MFTTFSFDLFVYLLHLTAVFSLIHTRDISSEVIFVIIINVILVLRQYYILRSDITKFLKHENATLRDDAVKILYTSHVYV